MYPVEATCLYQLTVPSAAQSPNQSTNFVAQSDGGESGIEQESWSGANKLRLYTERLQSQLAPSNIAWVCNSISEVWIGSDNDRTSGTISWLT